MLISVLTLCFIISPIIGFLLYKKLNKWELLDRLTAAILPTLLIILLNLFLTRLLSSPNALEGWNAARLAPLFGLINGYQLYYPQDIGPVSGYVYGPFGILVYLPAVLFKSINSVIISATFLASIFFFTPVLWLCIKDSIKEKKDLIFSILLFFCFFLASSQLPGLNYSAFGPHCDAPAMGFSALACGAIYFRKTSQGQQSNRSLILSAILISLALWSKQTALPLLPAAVIYILLTEDRKTFINFITYCLASLVIMSTAMSFIFGFQLLLFNVVLIPVKQPWLDENKLVALSWAFQELTRTALPLISILLFPTLVLFRLPKRVQFNHIRSWLSHHRWSLFLLTSLLMSITSVLNRVKVGGADNASTPAIYFLLIAVVLSFKDLYQTSNQLRGFNIKKPSQIYVLALLILLVTGQAKSFKELNDLIIGLPNTYPEAAYQILKANPGKIYFPFNPLAHIMLEGKLYHFAHGVYDRRIASFPLTQAHFDQNIPPQATLIASHTEQVMDDILAYKPDFQRIPQPASSNWLIFAKKGG